MKKLVLLVLAMIILVPLTALTIGGVDLPDKLAAGEDGLLLNGAGLRKKAIFRVYACGLYLPGKSASSEKILNDTTAIAIRMHFILSKVDEGKLIKAWNEGFAKTGALQEFAIETSKFNALFSEPAVKGDIYDIVYIPKTGVQVIKNNIVVGTINNPNFRKSVFSIWLAENTDLTKLREKLLGK